MPTVSVVMPSYNHGEFISEAIASVLGQTWTDLELVIVDDASQDDSRAVIERWVRDDPRVRAFFHAENQGIARTFNEALMTARGRFAAIFASDDIWLPAKLARQMEALASDETAVCWTDGWIVDRAGRQTGQTIVEWIHPGEDRAKSGNILEGALSGTFIFFPSLVARTESLRALGFDDRLHYLNDVKLGIQLAERFPYVFLDEKLVHYRIHDFNSSLRLNKEKWLQDARVFRDWVRGAFGRERAAWWSTWALWLEGCSKWGIDDVQLGNMLERAKARGLVRIELRP